MKGARKEPDSKMRQKALILKSVLAIPNPQLPGSRRATEIINLQAVWLKEQGAPK